MWLDWLVIFKILKLCKFAERNHMYYVLKYGTNASYKKEVRD